MINHRDSVQLKLDNDDPRSNDSLDIRIKRINDELTDMAGHFDRIYDRLYEYWEYMEKLSDCVASPPPPAAQI